jgi:TPP-dependent pyruvate/acetoin dehydrogenase alpha subunit
VLELPSFQELRGTEGQKCTGFFTLSVKKSWKLSTISRSNKLTSRQKIVPLRSSVIYNQRFIHSSSIPRPGETVTMTGKVRRTAATAEVSTGGSLISDAKLKQLYATMVRCRLLTEHAAGLREQPSAYQASIGQEALAAGWVIDLRPSDTIALAPDDSIAGLVKGVPLDEIVAQLYMRRSSANHKQTANGSMHNIIPPSSTPEQFRMVTEVASTNKRNKKGNVVVAFTRAASALDDWKEALELAAKRRLPIIFVVENNPWLQPLPTTLPGPSSNHAGSLATGEEEHLIEHARTHRLPVITVDGNDVVAIYRVACESLERVRQGEGPVLVEGKTYRESGQAKSRPGRRAGRDPLAHMERYLKARKLFTTRWKKQLVDEFSQELDTAIQASIQAARKTQGLASP